MSDDAGLGFATVTTMDVATSGVDIALERVRTRVGDRPLYVSIDIDVLDPAHAPGTGTPEPGGLTSINSFLQEWVPKITSSPAFKRNGLLEITFDESDGPQGDSSACCNEPSGPNSPGGPAASAPDVRNVSG